MPLMKPHDIRLTPVHRLALASGSTSSAFPRRVEASHAAGGGLVGLCVANSKLGPCFSLPPAARAAPLPTRPVVAGEGSPPPAAVRRNPRRMPPIDSPDLYSGKVFTNWGFS